MYIETPRMIIREFTPEDAADLHEIFGDDETMENCEPAYDFEKTKEFLTSFCIGRKAAVAAVHKETGKMVGYILFNELEKGVFEMGWFFNRSFCIRRTDFTASMVSENTLCAFRSAKAQSITALQDSKASPCRQKLRLKNQPISNTPFSNSLNRM